MHDKLRNEDSVKDVNNRLNDYFDLDSLNIEEISDSVAGIDEDNKNH